MNILAHRGLWEKPFDKNSLDALGLALELGVGVETDVRDHNGILVISHDPCCGAGYTRLEDLFIRYNEIGSSNCLAINIKSDGLAAMLNRLLARYEISNYFVFDMSVPDLMDHVKNGNKVLARLSDYEPVSRLAEMVAGFWVDEYVSFRPSAEFLSRQIENQKIFAFVSKELHGSDHAPRWDYCWRLSSTYPKYDKFFVCTDLVREAKSYFK